MARPPEAPFAPPAVAARSRDPLAVLEATRWPVLLVGLGLGTLVLVVLAGLAVLAGHAVGQGRPGRLVAIAVCAAAAAAVGVVPWRALRLALALDALARTPSRAHLLAALERQRHLWTAAAVAPGVVLAAGSAWLLIAMLGG